MAKDMSEGELYTKGLPGHGHWLPARGGCVWDVGANDGVWHSNSHYLIHELGFQAWLFEPDAATFTKLRNQYGRKGTRFGSKVRLFNMGVGLRRDIVKMKFFPMGFENTIVEYNRNQYDSQEYETYVVVENGKLLCEQQTRAIEAGLCRTDTNTTFTLLSVDVEKADAGVLAAAHSSGECHWDVVVAENESKWKMKEMGYRGLFVSQYNTVYVPSEEEAAQSNIR